MSQALVHVLPFNHLWVKSKGVHDSCSSEKSIGTGKGLTESLHGLSCWSNFLDICGVLHSLRTMTLGLQGTRDDSSSANERGSWIFVEAKVVTEREETRQSDKSQQFQNLVEQFWTTLNSCISSTNYRIASYLVPNKSLLSPLTHCAELKVIR